MPIPYYYINCDTAKKVVFFKAILTHKHQIWGFTFIPPLVLQKYLPSSFQQQLIVFPLRLPFQRIFKLNQEFSFEPNSNLNNLTGQPSAYIRLFCTPSILFVIPPLWMPMTLSFSPSTNIIGLPLCPSKVEIKCMIWPFFSLMSLIAFFNDSLLANRKDIFL